MPLPASYPPLLRGLVWVTIPLVLFVGLAVLSLLSNAASHAAAPCVACSAKWSLVSETLPRQDVVSRMPRGSLWRARAAAGVPCVVHTCALHAILVPKWQRQPSRIGMG